MIERPVDFDDGPPVDYDDDRLSAVAKLAKATELVADLVRKDNTGQGCAPGGRIGANDTLPLQSLFGLSLTHLHGADEITETERGFLAALDEDRPSPAEVTVHAAPQTYAGEASPPPPPPLVGHRPRVADLPCPKCGSEKTIMHWHEAGHDLLLSPRRRCVAYDRPGEHFHRECCRCLADWVTTDMLDAEEAK